MNEKKLKSFLEEVYASQVTVGINSLFVEEEAELDLKPYYIQEIAGRDSIAAMVKYLKENPERHQGVILSAAFSPTEFGNLQYVLDAFLIAEEIAKNYSLGVVFSASKDTFLWKKLTGENSFRYSRKYGFYTPCILCHLYFHLLRGYLAIDTQAGPVVSGERAFHGTKIKLNQTYEAAQAYLAAFQKADLEIVFPVLNVSEEEELLKLLPKNWKEGEEQLSCVFSGSSTIKDESEMNSIKESYKSFLEEVVAATGAHALLSYKEKATK